MYQLMWYLTYGNLIVVPSQQPCQSGSDNIRCKHGAEPPDPEAGPLVVESALQPDDDLCPGWPKPVICDGSDSSSSDNLVAAEELKLG